MDPTDRFQMSDTPTTILQKLGARYKRRVTSITLLDANVCSWNRPKEKPWESIVTGGTPLSKQLRIDVRGCKVVLRANDTYLTLSFFGSFEAERFAINLPDRNGLVLNPVGTRTIDGAKYALFTRRGAWHPSQEKVATAPEFSTLVKEAQISNRGLIAFDGGSVTLYVTAADLERTVRLIDLGVALAQRFEEAPVEQRFEKLPKKFHAIIPLIKKWAVGDDSDRDETLAGSSKRELSALVDRVAPYLDSIDSYLDSFGSQAPHEEAVALGKLAECAIEARLKLEKQEP